MADTHAVLQAALPEPEYPPPFVSKLACNPLVPSLIGLHFVSPELGSGLGCLVATWASVPETTVDEDRQFGSWEYEVWLSRQLLVSTPACNFERSENFDQSQLGCLVSLPADCGHPHRTLFRGKEVGCHD